MSLHVAVATKRRWIVAVSSVLGFLDFFGSIFVFVLGFCLLMYCFPLSSLLRRCSFFCCCRVSVAWSADLLAALAGAHEADVGVK